MIRTIAIVGAGMAGLAAARTLADLGFAPRVFEKSRGLGGRMATRRLPGHQFDHGAQYFTARGERFRSEVERWQREGVIAGWGPDRFVGAPTMTAPARHLGEGLDIVSEAQVTALSRTSAGWQITCTGPALGQQDQFDSVILAIPAPQVLPLLHPEACFREAVAGASYAPCWAMMLAFADRLTNVPDTHRTDGALAWIARDTSKPARDRDAERFVVHASPAWTRKHIDETSEVVAPKLLEQFHQATATTAEPVVSIVHRWRYALVETVVGIPCVWDEDLHLGACGDWCLGPRVEAAYESGIAMAHRIAAHATTAKAGSTAR